MIYRRSMSKYKFKYFDEFLDKCYEARFAQTKTKWYDSGVRDVYGEGFIKGLEKAKRLIVKSLKEYSPQDSKITNKKQL